MYGLCKVTTSSRMISFPWKDIQQICNLQFFRLWNISDEFRILNRNDWVKEAFSMWQILISLGWLAGHAYSNRVVETKTCLKLLADVKTPKWSISTNILNTNWSISTNILNTYWSISTNLLNTQEWRNTRSSGTPIELACIS